MNFNTMGELDLWLGVHGDYILDSGSQGVCYRIGDKVYKIFHQFIDRIDDEMIVYDGDDIIRFSKVINDTYVFPNDLIIVNGVVVGYVSDYVDVISLYKINPLYVDLDVFDSNLSDSMVDIKTISYEGILTFDVMYNIMYGNCGFKVIDTCEYSKTDIDSSELFKINRERFLFEIKSFLIDGYFDDFILNNKILFDMYNAREIDFNLFFKEFRNSLSEACGYRISRLVDAKDSIVLRKGKYLRNLCK